MLKRFENYSTDDTDVCIAALKEFSNNCRGKANLYLSLVILCSHIHQYCKIYVNTENCYDYASVEVNVKNKIAGIKVNRYSEITDEKKIADVNSQCKLLYNLMRNVTSLDVSELEDNCDKLFKFRNILVHNIRAYDSYVGKDTTNMRDSLPDMKFMEEVTNLIFGSDIGFEFTAKVIEHFSGSTPSKYKKWLKKKEEEDVYKKTIEWDESEFEIRK